MSCSKGCWTTSDGPATRDRYECLCELLYSVQFRCGARRDQSMAAGHDFGVVGDLEGIAPGPFKAKVRAICPARSLESISKPSLDSCRADSHPVFHPRLSRPQGRQVS